MIAEAGGGVLKKKFDFFLYTSTKRLILINEFPWHSITIRSKH